MLSFLIVHPARRSAETAVLLFLHGAREGFRDPKISGLGIRNLFRQGVPKVLCDPNATLAPEHPLMAGSFVVVAPQLTDSDTPWHTPEHVQQIEQALDGLALGDKRKTYLIGFSKGGRGAFQLAAPLSCRAVVAIDTSPMKDDPATVAGQISSCQAPLWMIWTDYPSGHKLDRIPRMHAHAAVPEHRAGSWNALVAPAPGARCKSMVTMDHVPPDGRHGALCTAVASSRAPYDWLLQH